MNKIWQLLGLLLLLSCGLRNSHVNSQKNYKDNKENTNENINEKSA